MLDRRATRTSSYRNVSSLKQAVSGSGLRLIPTWNLSQIAAHLAYWKWQKSVKEGRRPKNCLPHPPYYHSWVKSPTSQFFSFELFKGELKISSTKSSLIPSLLVLLVGRLLERENILKWSKRYARLIITPHMPNLSHHLDLPPIFAIPLAISGVSAVPPSLRLGFRLAQLHFPHGGHLPATRRNSPLQCYSQFLYGVRAETNPTGLHRTAQVTQAWERPQPVYVCGSAIVWFTGGKGPTDKGKEENSHFTRPRIGEIHNVFGYYPHFHR